MKTIVVAESLCDAAVTLSILLGVMYTMLDLHLCEPTKAIIILRLKVCFTLRWSSVVHGLMEGL